MGDGWKVYVGGTGGGKSRLAQQLTRVKSDAEAMEMIDRIVDHFKANAKPHQRIGAMIDKMGFDVYKAAVLGEQD